VVPVEPGVYLPGIGGIRLEDTVKVTASGCERITFPPQNAHTTGLRRRAQGCTHVGFPQRAEDRVHGAPFVIVYFQHVKARQRGSLRRTKLKNLKTGAVIEHTFPQRATRSRSRTRRAGDAVHVQDEGQFHFMDTRTYEQIYLDEGHVEGAGIT